MPPQSVPLMVVPAGQLVAELKPMLEALLDAALDARLVEL
jgi:hypothetical protein